MRSSISHPAHSISPTRYWPPVPQFSPLQHGNGISGPMAEVLEILIHRHSSEFQGEWQVEVMYSHLSLDFQKQHMSQSRRGLTPRAILTNTYPFRCSYQQTPASHSSWEENQETNSPSSSFATHFLWGPFTGFGFISYLFNSDRDISSGCPLYFWSLWAAAGSAPCVIYMSLVYKAAFIRPHGDS